ncbi:S8/S53 family peptidase [Rhodopila sp.]|uniref:S8/S53 family peptidase n=1 Tax=Rhodopila sp. TaxID=2480087 RepID=UPI003D0A52E3
MTVRDQTPFTECFAATRLIVQGMAPYEGASAPDLQTRLRYEESNLGFKYLIDLRQHLLNHHVDIGPGLKSLPSHHLLEVTSGTVAGITTGLIRRFSDVAFVEPDVELGLSAPFVPDLPQFAMYKAGVLPPAAAHAVGRGIRIAVVDSGAEPSSGIAGFRDLADLQNANRPGGPMHLDRCGHGTSMVAIIKTIAPAADVYMVRVCKDSVKLKLWDLHSAISTAALELNADIVSLSLGCTDLGGPCMVCGGTGPSRSASLESYIQAIHLGVRSGRPVFVAAAGNANPKITNSGINGFDWPACYEAVIAVGAVRHAPFPRAYSRSSFSKIAPLIKASRRYVMCPGGETQTGQAERVGAVTYLDSTGINTVPITGTSPATAFASAILACYDEYATAAGTKITGDALLSLAFNDCKRDLWPSYQEREHGMGRLVFDPP